MVKKFEQRACLKFCDSNGITAMKSLKMLQKCFGKSTLSRAQVFECHKAFSEGREVVEKLPHANHPSRSVNDDNIEKVKKIVLENRRVGIREVAEALNIFIDRLNTLWFMFWLLSASPPDSYRKT